MKDGAGKARCAWAGSDPLYLAYHDREWGVPSRTDRHLFEMLVLEGAQAGLSWITILRKRERYREVFDGFVPDKVARYGRRKIESLMKDPGIVRNRAKVEGAVRSAAAFLEIAGESGGFHRFLWGFVGGEPIQNRWTTPKRIPAETKESRALSKELKRRGFAFVGPTVCYAFMQAVGMVNDHVVSCYRHRELGG